MPTNIDEVRRAFEQHPIAGARNGTNGHSVAVGRGDASGGDGTSDVNGTRPTEHRDDGDRTVEPAVAVAKSDSGKPARASSRAGSDSTRAGKRAVTAPRPEQTSNLERLLFTTHALLVARTDIQALRLPPAQAKELATAITELNALYGGKGGIIGPKAYAWLKLLSALGGTYGPMIKDARKEVREAERKNVTDIPAGPQ
jgi:hypothetical protein